MIKIVFGNLVELKEVKGEMKFSFLGRSGSAAPLIMCFIYTPLIFYYIFFTFWSVFLLDNSFICDPKLDCFPFHEKNVVWNGHNYFHRPLQTSPIVNCSDYESGNKTNVTIICYTFVFNFPTALATAGGLLAITGAGLNKFKAFAVWAFDKPGVLKQGRGMVGISCSKVTQIGMYLVSYVLDRHINGWFAYTSIPETIYKNRTE